MGSQLGQRASKTACLVRADLGTNLIKQGGKCQSTNWLGSSVGRVLERARGFGFESRLDHDFGSPKTYSGSVWVPGWDYEQQKGRSGWYLRCFEHIRGRIYLSRGKLSEVGQMAPLLSCLTDSERPWVRVPVGPRFFPSV